MLPVSGAEQFHALRGQRALAELGGDIGVVEILQALAGVVVGQEEVPEAFLLGLVLGFLQHLELLRRKAPAILFAFAGLGEFDRHRLDGFADELPDVIIERPDLVRHPEVVELVAGVEGVIGGAGNIGVFCHCSSRTR
ncbi:hypothetical protein ACVWWG_005713 [Bradyrhizobium sp. LB7.2]